MYTMMIQNLNLNCIHIWEENIAFFTFYFKDCPKLRDIPFVYLTHFVKMIIFTVNDECTFNVIYLQFDIHKVEMNHCIV